MHTRITKTDKANGIPICDINIKCILLTIIITSNNTKCKQYLSLFYKIVSSQTVTYLLIDRGLEPRKGRKGRGDHMEKVNPCNVTQPQTPTVEISV